MAIDPRLKLLNEYYNLCINLSLPFPYDYDNLIQYPERINTWEIKNKIRETLHPSPKKVNSNSTLKIKTVRRKAKKKSIGKKPMHLTTVVVDKSFIKKVKTAKKSKKKPKKKNVKKFRRAWGRVIPSGITQ